MAVTEKISTYSPGLKLKRGLGEKIIIRHGDEELVLQIVSFSSGKQVTIGFDDPTRKFKIRREELSAE